MKCKRERQSLETLLKALTLPLWSEMRRVLSEPTQAVSVAAVHSMKATR
jgi:hypothetical protein